MKNSKKLQKIADKSLNYLNDEEFLQTLKNNCKSNSQHNSIKPRKQFFTRKWVYLSSFALVAAVVSCFLFLPPATKEKQYMAENLKSIESSIEELNKEMHYYQIHNKCTVTKYYDSIYDDTLYYSVYYDIDNLESLKIIIKINKNYNYEFPHAIYNQKIKYKEFYLQYYENYTIDEDIYFFVSKGEISSDQEILYIEYQGIGFDANSNFFDLLSQVIA